MRCMCALVLTVCCIAAVAAQGAEPVQLDFSPSPLERVLSRAARVEGKLECPRVPKPPQIDGKLGDAVWAGAARIEGLVTVSGAPGRPHTRARICFDDRALYLAIECEGAPAATPLRERDRGAWKDDCIEVWIDPTGRGKVSYQFIVSAAGSIYDAKRKAAAGDASHDPEWRHAVGSAGDQWTVEMSIPKEAVECKRWPALLGFNVGRNGPGMETQAWSREYGDATQSKLVLLGAAASGPTSAAKDETPRDPLRVVLDRPYLRAGERWLEAKLVLARDRVGEADVVAEVYALAGRTPRAQARTRPSRSEGVLLVDLRSLDLAQARLCVKLEQDGRAVSVKEMLLSAREPKDVLAAGQRVAVKLDLPKGIDAVEQWPVVFGMPFGEGMLWDTDRVRLVTAAGRPVPCQKEVVARWAREGATQWLRCDALVSSRESYFVELGEPDAPRPAVGPVSVRSEDGRLVLSTGSARYVLAKGPSPVAEVWLGGRRVAAASKRGLYVVDQKGRTAIASGKDESVAVEANGPLAASVRFEGLYRTEKGEALAKHITRVEAFAGQPFARVTHTLVLVRDTNEVWFRDVGWEFTVSPGAGAQAVFGVSRDEWRKSQAVALGGDCPSARMIQDQHYRFDHGENHCAVLQVAQDGSARPVLEGQECGDWAALAGRDASFVMVCREAARQHPKEFEVWGDRMVLHLFSNRAGEELDFRVPVLVERWGLKNWYDHVLATANKNLGQLERVRAYTTNAVGWAKTHELVLSPMAVADVPAQAGRLAYLNRHPMLALADPLWIYRTKVINNGIHPRDAERYPFAEGLIDATFDVWERRVHEWGEYGFVDYFAGPHLGYKGKYPIVKRYCPFTYTLRGDLWIGYARSGARRMGEFAAATNKAYIDNIFCHHDGGGKIAGLFNRQAGGDTPKGDSKHSLPFYWGSSSGPNVSSSSDLDNFLRLYYLMGCRRAKDHVHEYAEGMKRYWTPSKAARDWRGIMTMRLLAQAYAFTWDPELRAMAEATTESFLDSEGELGLSKDRPYRSSSYKTQVDIAGLLDAWRIFGSPLYRDLCKRISLFWWRDLLGRWPIFYTNPQGRIGQFLHEQTGDPAYVQGLWVQMRYAATAYDPDTGKAIGNQDGRIGAHQSTFVFQGIGYAQDLIARAAPDGQPVASWAGVEDFGFPASFVVFKQEYEAVEIDVKTVAPGGGAAGGVRLRPVGSGTTSGMNLTRMVEASNGVVSLRIPKDAPEGAYEIVPDRLGTHFALCHSRAPLVVHAPRFFRPSPPQAPPVRWYFRVPEDAADAQVLFEAPTRLLDPQGKPWPGDEPVSGWIDLPSDRPGLWSFAARSSYTVAVRNLPPFFAAESPDHYFEPKIPWERVPPAQPFQKPGPDVVYVPGAIGTAGNQALSLAGRRRFYLKAGPDHPSGDGGRFVPFQQGTIEFFIQPYWSTYELPAKAYKTLVRMAAKHSWTLSHNKDTSRHSWMLSHVLYGYFYSDGDKRRITMRAYRRTIFERGRWHHVAWVWGLRSQATFKAKKRVQILTARLYVDGARGQSYSYAWEGNRPADRPSMFYLLGSTIDAAYDELRLSDAQRYTDDFAAPSRDREFEVDEHTRALFHFNGNIDGLSHGHAGPLPASFDRPK